MQQIPKALANKSLSPDNACISFCASAGNQNRPEVLKKTGEDNRTALPKRISLRRLDFFASPRLTLWKRREKATI
jgi:hypothetical protein